MIPTIIISNNSHEPDITGDVIQKALDTKVYKRRLWILCLFSLLSMMCAITFPQYVVMANVNSCFYEVSLEAINWTATLFLIVYLVFFFPVSYLVSNYLDIRWTVICAAFCNTLSSSFQFCTTKPNGFIYVMLSAFVASLSNLFVLGVPPFLAARWFPSHELSRACAFGVFGNQLGTAFGFLMSPLVVSSECSEKDLIGVGKLNVAFILSGVNILIFILVTFTFQNAPKLPPSIGEAQKKKEPDIPYKTIVVGILKSTDFILILVTYGLMVGSYYAFSTILNELISKYFEHRETEIGWMGLLLIVAGLVGSLIAGCILDCTKMFKETTFGICLASLVTFMIFSGCLYVNQIWVQFVTISMFGFFLTSFLPIGFEYGIEVTYPQSEALCASLLNASAMFFGIVLTELLSHLLQSEGPLSSNAALALILFLCCVISSFITKEYKRSKKNEETKESPSN